MGGNRNSKWDTVTNMIRILIADDHDVVRMGLRLLLEQQADMQVVGEASDGIEATEMTARLLPDILLMDISMPRMGGNEAARRIALLGLPTRIVILSMHSEEAIVRTALEGGAKGYLVKSSVRTDLAPAIHAAYRGETFLSPSIEDLVVKQFLVRKPAAQDDVAQMLGILTEREQTVFRMIAHGDTNKTMAQKLHISSRTVEKHRATLMLKLGTPDIASLMQVAIRAGLCETQA